LLGGLENYLKVTAGMMQSQVWHHMGEVKVLLELGQRWQEVAEWTEGGGYDALVLMTLKQLWKSWWY